MSFINAQPLYGWPGQLWGQQVSGLMKQTSLACTMMPRINEYPCRAGYLGRIA
jgi:hypothetical protein